MIERLLDRLRHPGETGTMRLYRRYREGVDHAYKVREPYDPADPNPSLTATTEAVAGDPWPTSYRRTLVEGYLEARREQGPIVGVTMHKGGSDGQD